MKLTTDLRLVLKLSTNGDLPRVPHINAWLAHGKLYKLGMKYYSKINGYRHVDSVEL
jgi:hypothetical protein